MSFVNKAHDPRRRATAIAGTVAIHAALGIAVVTGLTIAGQGPVVKFAPTIDFPTEPPPPVPAPTPTPTVASDPLPPVRPVPKPPIELPRIPDPGLSATDFPKVPVGPVRPPIVSPPLPEPSFTPRGASPSNDRLRWITTADYPASALRREDEGLAAYRVIVGSDGRVSACEITAGTGSRALDDATCRFISKRARFDAATDETGTKVVGSYSGTVRWRIPD